jgi:gamma-glutamylcyclotransferase (GGCT)/AIG2-like uncharacterized protein YtfP
VSDDLFAYGTLRDSTIQRKLFATELPMQPATVRGWEVRKGDDGYLFIRPKATGIVHGSLLSLNADQLSRADLWEDIPKYARERLLVRLSNGSEREVWAYTRREAQGDFVDQNASSSA